jgi:hypothetical protein
MSRGAGAPVAPRPSGNGAPAAPPREPAPRRRTLGGLLKSSHLIIAAVAGLASVLVSLLFQFAPSLKPDPGDNVGADVQVVAIEPDVTVGQWIARAFNGQAEQDMRAKYGQEQLVFRGSVLLVHLSVDGHKHRDVSLTYRIFRRSTQRDVTSSLTTSFAPPAKIGIDAPSERSVQLMFLPDLSDEDDLFLRVELSDADGLLAVATSPQIHRGLLPFR